MITSNGMEHWDSFNDSIVFWVNVKGVPNNCVEKAKNIDKSNYDPNCFGVCVDFDETGFCIVEDEPLHELYYIDDTGNRNYMKCQLNDEERKAVLKECRNEILRIMSKSTS